jgi:uncharacterized protein (DUF58 family)
VTSSPKFLATALQRLRERAKQENSRRMWQNFATALGVLGIALLSALYSSSAARDGRMLPAGISAVVALLIAIWVGVRFVPRLAANVEWDWLPFRSHYEVTRDGWIYLGAVAVVVFAAVNTNNNLLYMVLSALIAVLLLSGFLASVNFRGLKLLLRIPQHCFAGDTFAISIRLQNQKVLFPSLALIVDNVPGADLRLKRFFLSCIRGQSETVYASQALLPSRGRYRIQRLKILSRYPFGFFLKGREYPVDAECICFPEILPADQLHLSAIDILGSEQRFERGFGNDLYMIRDYLPSDSARHVHWKASAKTAALKTREFAAEDSRRVTLYLDRFARMGDREPFEKLVSYAASLTVHLVSEGMEVALATDEWQSGFGNSEPHAEDILRYLALVQSSMTVGSLPPNMSDGTLMLSLRRETT